MRRTEKQYPAGGEVDTLQFRVVTRFKPAGMNKSLIQKNERGAAHSFNNKAT